MLACFGVAKLATGVCVGATTECEIMKKQVLTYLPVPQREPGYSPVYRHRRGQKHHQAAEEQSLSPSSLALISPHVPQTRRHLMYQRSGGGGAERDRVKKKPKTRHTTIRPQYLHTPRYLLCSTLYSSYLNTKSLPPHCLWDMVATQDLDLTQTSLKVASRKR